MKLLRPLRISAFALIAPMILTGCVQLHSDTVIDARGGGESTIVISMSTAVSEAIAEMEDLDMDGGPGDQMPAFSDIDRQVIESRVKDHGVEIKTFERATVDGRETLTIRYAFADMRGFSAALGAIMASGDDSDDNGLGIFDAGDGNFVLRSASYDFPAWEDPAPEPADESTEDPATADPEAMQKQFEVMGKLMGAIGELDIVMKITVPGDVVSTNAPQQEGRTSIWAINAENMMSADQDMEPEIVFSGQGLKIEPMAP